MTIGNTAFYLPGNRRQNVDTRSYLATHDTVLLSKVLLIANEKPGAAGTRDCH